MNFSFKKAKMLICLVGRSRGEQLMSIAKKSGAKGGTIGLAHSLGKNPFLNALGLADVHQDILFTLLGPEKEAVQTAIAQAAKDNPKKFAGIAAVIDVSRVLTRLTPEQEKSRHYEIEERRETMESGYELITIITNSGYAEDAMAAARKAGATGGTILNARGTGTDEDVRFFGITLVPEKDMLMMVAAKDKVADIIKAVSALPGLAEPGGGIIFTSNVEEFIVLGQNPDF